MKSDLEKMLFGSGDGRPGSDLEKMLFGHGDGRQEAIHRHTVSWTDDDGKTHTETKTTMTPSKKGAVAGAAAGAALGSAVPVIGTVIGAAVGGIAGFIFGPED